MEWLAFIFIIFVLWHFVVRRAIDAAISPPAQRRAPARPVVEGFAWPKLDHYDFDVVGESFHQDTLEDLAGDHGDESAEVYTTAHLVIDNHNPHDNKAVRVDIQGRTVGHLSRDDARSFRRRLGAKKLGASTTACGALIMGGFTDRHGNKKSYGVRLDLAPFDN